jgi:hypothetical protein
MSNLESRLEKLEARVPVEQRLWVRKTFDPKDYCDSAEMDAAIEKASQEAWNSGKNLIARILCDVAEKEHQVTVGDQARFGRRSLC